METASEFFLGLVLLVLFLVLILYWRERKLRRLKASLLELGSRKKSGEVLHGKAWEEFAPFMKGYPFDPRNFKFIGMPVDGLSFEEDAIYFVEIKTGQSQLSQKQKYIKEQVEHGRVKWLEIRS